MSCSRRPLETRRSSAGASRGLRRSRLERGAGRRCLQTGSGCSRCVERTWSCCRPGLVRWSRCPRETWCGLETERGCPTRSASSSLATPRTTRREATFRRSQPAFLARSRRREWFSPAKRRRETRTPSSAASAPRGCSFRFKAAMAGPFQRSRLEISRFNGAMAADTCTPSPASMGARQAAVDVFRVEVATGGRTALENAHAVRPRRESRTCERTRRDHSGRAVVLLLLHATARRPVRGRWAEVSQLTPG